MADEPHAVGRPHVPDRNSLPIIGAVLPPPTALAGAARAGDLIAERLQ
ncbi:hypothetical protein ACFYXJ_00375 [Streptomyces sp. NPDC002667]